MASDYGSMDQFLDVVVTIQLDPGLDEDASERTARQLRGEIKKLDVESVKPLTPMTVPEGGHKGADPVIVAFLISLSAAGGVLTTLIATLQAWLERRSSANRISLSINGEPILIENVSSEERMELLKAYIRQHELS